MALALSTFLTEVAERWIMGGGVLPQWFSGFVFWPQACGCQVSVLWGLSLFFSTQRFGGKVTRHKTSFSAPLYVIPYPYNMNNYPAWLPSYQIVWHRSKIYSYRNVSCDSHTFQSPYLHIVKCHRSLVSYVYLLAEDFGSLLTVNLKQALLHARISHMSMHKQDKHTAVQHSTLKQNSCGVIYQSRSKIIQSILINQLELNRHLGGRV